MLCAVSSTQGAKHISDVTLLIALQLQQELILPMVSKAKINTTNSDWLVESFNLIQNEFKLQVSIELYVLENI